MRAMKNSDPKKAASEELADIKSARTVMVTEAQGILRAADELGPTFSRAVEMLLTTRGRVIVSGLGKSGHIARKIAATFASTGTPAQYVHPAEASHGDLGMITKADTMLVVSNSGENRELSDIIVHSRRFLIPLIAITSRADSTLAQQSDLVLLLPSAPEACPMGLAPTTSTAMALALGDALAVALINRRSFTKDDFRVLHPGGALGAALLHVRDIMHTGEAVPLVVRNAPMSEVLLAMTAKGFGCAGVVEDGGRLCGIITDGDLRRHMSADLLGASAQSVMTPDPRTIDSEALVAEAIHVMNEGGPRAITTLFVTGESTGVPVGIIHLHDCLRTGA